MSLPSMPPSVTRVQGLITFLLIAVVGITLGLRTELQQQDLQAQQQQIAQNTRRIAQAQYQSCLGGIAILTRFNAEQTQLAQLERKYPSVSTPLAARKARERAVIYENARYLPLPTCQEPPR